MAFSLIHDLSFNDLNSLYILVEILSTVLLPALTVVFSDEFLYNSNAPKHNLFRSFTGIYKISKTYQIIPNNYFLKAPFCALFSFLR